jgi:HK97 family phage major capsid protein
VSDGLGRFGTKALVAGGAVTAPPAFDPSVHALGTPGRFVRSAIPNGDPADGTTFTYLAQTTRTVNAAPVDPGGVKPTSVFTVTRVDDTFRTIAHLSEAINRADLDDSAALRQFLESELRLGLLLEVDAQILHGDSTGTPAGYSGLANLSGVQDQPFVTDVLTTARKAITLVEVNGLATPSAILLHPNDWEVFELSKSTGGSEEFHLPTAPVNRAAATIWGVAVISSVSVVQGTGWVGDFARQSRYREREQTRVDWSEATYDAGEAATDFERNLIRFRAESRGGIEWFRPAAFCSFEVSEGASAT